MFHTLNDVFEWLGEKTGDPTFYLMLLSEGSKERLAAYRPVFKEFSVLMTPYPETTRSLLLENFGGWRGALVGNMIAVLQNTAAFETDQAIGILRGSWVAPQLAAGIALTSTGVSVPLLEAFLELAVEETHLQHPKRMLSAYAALKLLGNRKADEFAQTSLFTELQSADQDDCLGIAFSYYRWDLWRGETDGM